MYTQSILPIFIVILIVGLIGVVIYVFVDKDNVINTGKGLVDKDKGTQKANGYGTYKKLYESPCNTSDGKCSSSGLKWVTEYCEAHPVTGRGCIDDNGQQTFAPRSSSVLCHPNCRSFILKETTSLSNSSCNYDYPYSLSAYNCITPNATTAQYRTFNCVKNDTIGDNTCTYQCSSSGIDSNGMFGDADPTKISFIPQCQSNPGSTVTLRQIPWNSIKNLGSSGVKIKGYTVKNKLLADGSIDPVNFSISPAYNQWTSSPVNTITYDELLLLDSTLTIYENCPIDPQYVKPECSDYYVYRPTEPESDLTPSQLPSLCTLNKSFYPIKECFYNPWYLLPGSINPLGVTGGTGLYYVNPYVGFTGGNTGASYSWLNIGNYGYISVPTTCSKGPTPALGPTGPNNQYIIPETPINNATCLNLRAIPPQCSNTYTNIFSVPASVSLSKQIEQEIFDFEGNTGIFPRQVTSVYPVQGGTTNFTCQTQYPDGTIPTDLNGNTIPGCIQTCQYKPSNDVLNFYSPDFNNNYLGDSNLYDLLGNYIEMYYLDSSNNEYFLGVDNILCGNTGGYLPLQNCLANPSASTQMPLTYIYSGGTGINAGNFWSKNNCDQESIELASNLRLLFSPHFAMNYPVTNDYGFACDIYAYIGGLYGYLSPTISGNINSSINITSLFTGSNIVANQTSSSNIYFNLLSPGQQIPRSDPNNTNDPFFYLLYNSVTEVYTINGYNPYKSIEIDKYNGNVYSPSNIAFTFTNKLNKVPNQGYYKTMVYSDPIIKSAGTLYAGKDVTRTISLQRQQSKYSYSNCISTSATDVLCYPETCNIYY